MLMVTGRVRGLVMMLTHVRFGTVVFVVRLAHVRGLVMFMRDSAGRMVRGWGRSREDGQGGQSGEGEGEKGGEVHVWLVCGWIVVR